MTTDSLAQILRAMYAEGATKYRKAAMVHLFGIKYADELEGRSIPEVLRRARVPHSYVSEVHKGMALAEYVEVKEEWR